MARVEACLRAPPRTKSSRCTGLSSNATATRVRTAMALGELKVACKHSLCSTGSVPQVPTPPCPARVSAAIAHNISRCPAACKDLADSRIVAEAPRVHPLGRRYVSYAVRGRATIGQAMLTHCLTIGFPISTFRVTVCKTDPGAAMAWQGHNYPGIGGPVAEGACSRVEESTSSGREARRGYAMREWLRPDDFRRPRVTRISATRDHGPRSLDRAGRMAPRPSTRLLSVAGRGVSGAKSIATECTAGVQGKPASMAWAPAH